MKNSGVRPVPRLTKNQLLRTGLRTISLIFLYYCFSIGITFFQKSFIAGFPFPLFVVLCHLVLKYLLAAIVRQSHRLCSGQSRPAIPWSVSWSRAAVTGVASSLDIGFSNWSFEFITISLYTMAKTSCVVFILAFAIFFGLERKRVSVVSVVMLISSGLLMFTYKSTQFRWEGFLLVMAASFLAGLRWTMAQLLMQRKDTGLSNPVDMMFVTQPYMIATLSPLVLLIEVVPMLRGDHPLVSELQDVTSIVLCILIGSSLAFLMELSEYLLLSYTSSLTLSISSIFKETITLFLAYEYNNDSMSLINCLGFLLCMSGIGLHVWIKVRDVSDERPSCESEESEVQQLIEDIPVESCDMDSGTSKELKVMLQHEC